LRLYIRRVIYFSFFILHFSFFIARLAAHCERDSSGTTRCHEMAAGDGADSPTRANEVSEAARPNKKTFFKKILH